MTLIIILTIIKMFLFFLQHRDRNHQYMKNSTTCFYFKKTFIYKQL